MADKQTSMTTRQDRQPSVSRPFEWSGSPFRMMRRLADEMDRMFDDVGFGRASGSRTGGLGFAWAPDVEVFQKNDELTIKADLPGLKKDEVTVEVTDDALTIHGERKREQEDQREGFYRTERSYGSFYRTIPLPEGAIADQAKAEFKDGVLEITMPAPPASKGRRLEITEGANR